VKVTIEEKPLQEVLLNIEVEPDEMNSYLERAYRNVVQRVNIPGFRKGKAPRSVVERHVGKDALLSQAMDFMVPEITSKAIKEKELEPAVPPKMEVVELDPVTIKATVALRPKIDLNDYKLLRVEKEDNTEIAQEHVERVLGQMHSDSLPWEPAHGAANFGDMVTLDVLGLVDGKTVVDNKGVALILAKGSSRPVPNFSERLEGIKQDERRENSLTFPEDHPEKEVAGKDCLFTVTATEIKEKLPSIIDDEFAKGIGEGFESLEALRARIKQDLTDQSNMETMRVYEDRVVAKVIESANVEVSEILVEHEIDHILADEEATMKQKRLSMEDYLSRVGKSADELRADIRDGARERLVKAITLEKVTQEEGIEITSDEVDAEIGSIIQQSPGAEDMITRLFQSTGGRERLLSSLRTRKAIHRLVEIASGDSPPNPEDLTLPRDESGKSVEEVNKDELGTQ